MSWGKYGRITSITEITICFKNVLHNMWDQPFNILYTSAASIWRFLWWIVTGLSLERSSLKSALYYVPLVPLCLTRLRAYVPAYFRPFASYLLSCFFNALRTFIFLSAFIFVCVLCAFIFLCTLRVFLFLRALHAFIFYVPYVSSFFTRLMYLHFFKYFQFLTCLMCIHLL